MRKYRNDVNRIIHDYKLCALRSKFRAVHPKLLVLSSVLLALVILCLTLCPEQASSGPYLNSAHGKSDYGVNRSSLSTSGYSTGNCAHCHEQHASIGGDEPAPDDNAPSKYALFYPLFSDQANSFCFTCHGGLLTAIPPVPTIQVSMPSQYNYSRMAGGGMNTCPASINEAFQFVGTGGTPILNCSSSSGSSHFLANICSFLSTQTWGFGSYVDNINPCSGCHNPHRAQRDPHTTAGRIDENLKLVSAVSLPSTHTNLTTWELWGDDTTERMDKYNYQPPCRVPRSECTGREPDGFATRDASRTVDYVTFCLDCHQNKIGSVRAIDWSAGGDLHGAGYQNCCDYGDRTTPYFAGHYLLSCLDCHEPHGSPNEYLLRQAVNGRAALVFGIHKYYEFCIACHRDLAKHTVSSVGPDADCYTCHNHGSIYPTTDLEPECSDCGSVIRSF